MNAGRPPISGPDFTDEYRERATQLARRFAVMEGVVGVALIGDVTLGMADRHSAVRLNVYLHARTLRTWRLGEAPLPTGESLYRGLTLDLEYLDFHIELDRDWSHAERWQATTVEILYDPERRVSELFAIKAEVGHGEIERAAIIEAASARELLDRATPAWLYRGDARAAHSCVNRAVDEVARLAWLLNGRLPPDVPWLIVRSTELETLPDNWAERIDNALTVREPSVAEASRRRAIVSALVRDLWTKMFPNSSLDARRSYVEQTRMLRELALAEEIPLAEYQSRYPLSHLNLSPAFELLSIIRERPELAVRFDRDRLRALVHQDLGRFMDHQQRLLRELADLVDGAGAHVDQY